MRVATPIALYKLKKDTARTLDQRDAAALRGSNLKRSIDVAVQKFHSAEEMNAAPVEVPVEVPVGNAFDRFVRHCARYRAISPRIYPRGVFRFRSIDEAQAARERVANHDQSSPLPGTDRTAPHIDSQEKEPW